MEDLNNTPPPKSKRKTSKKATPTDEHYKVLQEIGQRMATLEIAFTERQKAFELNKAAVDSLENEVFHKKKNWHTDPATITSLLAVVISFFSVVYAIWQEGDKSINEKRVRAKEIIKRLTDISRDVNMNPSSFPSFQAEASNLIDETVKIANENESLLNSSEYIKIVEWSSYLNKTEHLETMINRGLNLAADTATIYALKNQKAYFYALYKNDIIAAREIYKEVIELTSKQRNTTPEARLSNIAAEHLSWSFTEFQCRNYRIADSLLKVAETTLGLPNNSWRFNNYPILKNIQKARVMIDSLKNSGAISITLHDE